MSTIPTTNALQKWQELLQFVYENPHSDFYRCRFDQAGFNPSRDFHTLEDIRRISFLWKKELIEAGKEDKLLFVPEKEVWAVSSTSGTTSGTPLTTFLSPSAHATRKKASTDVGRVLIIFAPLRVSQVVYLLQLRGQLSLLGDIHNLPATAALAARTGVRSMTLTPSLAILFRKYVEAYPELVKNIECLSLVGEALAPAKKKLLRELYPGVRMFSTYASSEAGRAGSQCPYLADEETTTRFHANTEGHSFEILVPGSDEPCARGEQGELVLTDFTNRATPAIRYRTGDILQIIDEPCPCGSPEPLFEVHGRAAGDFVRAGGFELRRDMVEAPLLRLHEIVREDFEVRVREEYNGTRPFVKVAVALALQEGITDTPSVRERIVREFAEHWRLSPSLNLGAAIAAGLFVPLEISFADFPRMPKATQRMILD